jgi:GH15 family glucan-1,4-alpha-glucosidase
LPESVGGARNWDYRYRWIRDAAFSLHALMRLGFTDEAAAFMTWLEERCREATADRGLQVLYAIDGNPEVPESVLDHLDGYRGSRPVRVGNSAAGQFQLDIYGELVDSVYMYNKYGRPIGYDLWEALGRQLDWLEKHWQLPDDGIWESRGAGTGPRTRLVLVRGGAGPGRPRRWGPVAPPTTSTGPCNPSGPTMTEMATGHTGSLFAGSNRQELHR